MVVESVVNGIELGLESGLGGGDVGGIVEVSLSNRGRSEACMFTLVSGVEGSLVRSKTIFFEVQSIFETYSSLLKITETL